MLQRNRVRLLIAAPFVVMAFGICSAWAQQSNAPRLTYCCNEANGQQICSDQLPRQCYRRAYVIMEGSTVLQRVEAELTAEQRKIQEAEKQRKLEEERARVERLRRDKILTQTYSSIQEIDVQRERSIKEIEQGMLQAQNELVDLEKKRQALNEETEFYKRRSLPQELRAAIRSNEADIASQQSIIDSKKKDIEKINARFDEDKSRYLYLLRNAPKAAE